MIMLVIINNRLEEVDDLPLLQHVIHSSLDDCLLHIFFAQSHLTVPDGAQYLFIVYKFHIIEANLR